MKNDDSNVCIPKALRWLTCISISLYLLACNSAPTPESYDPEGSTITTAKEIKFQIRRTWRFQGINFTNQFAGARLSHVEKENDTLFHLFIEPENAPINKSPWYGFGVWSDDPTQILGVLHYPNGYEHRYYPTQSYDSKTWLPIDSGLFSNDTIQHVASVTLNVGKDTLYISAQPRFPSSHTYAWADSLTLSPEITSTTIGYSVLGQPIKRVQLGNPDANKAIVVLGRQHPPEVTGYLAMQAFVARLLQKDSLALEFRRQYSILLYPIINPDGVDQGHWRHNAAGVDLNRDWVEFNQPETKAIKMDVETSLDKATLIFAIDFHSTQEDLFYVFNRERPSNNTGLTHRWLDELDLRIPDYKSFREETTGTSPVSTRYFYENFHAEAVTYEVGDNSTVKRIEEVSSEASEILMQQLMNVE